jgi:hypothetical protein
MNVSFPKPWGVIPSEGFCSLQVFGLAVFCELGAGIGINAPAGTINLETPCT